MMQQTIGVWSGTSDLVQALRERCPSLIFEDAGDARDASRIAVLDEDHDLSAPPAKSLVRVILGPPAAERRQGELHVDRETFLASPNEYLSFAADLAATVVHASRLETEVGYLTHIHELMTMVDADAVSERITKTVLDLFHLKHGTLFLHDPRLERYVVSYSNDVRPADSDEFLPGIPSDVLQRALSSGRSLAIQRNDDGSGMIVMPLQMEHDLIGVVKVPLAKEEAVTDDVCLAATRYIQAVAQVLGNIYQLTRSRDLAMRDDLTKAFNRRFFESYLDEEMERSRRYGTLFSIIFLDLDDLKMVNNFYGHLTGSRTLQEVAKRILNAVRGIDKVVRFGGDEFCIILPQTDQDQAMLVANRVRKSLTSSPLHVDTDVEVTITASFGIATYPTHATTKENLIRQADLAMYRVKSSTKNAVGVASVDDVTKPMTL